MALWEAPKEIFTWALEAQNALTEQQTQSGQGWQ